MALSAVTGVLQAAITGNAAGAITAEGAAHLVMSQLYPGKTVADLSNEERMNLSAISTAIAGLAGGLVADSSMGVGTGASAGKNAVENNYLGQAAVKAAETKCGHDLSCQQQAINDFIQGHDESLKEGVIIQSAVVGGVLTVSVLPGAAIIGGSLSGAINAGMQYTMNTDGSINWTDVGISTGVGVITGGVGTGFLGTLGWNAAGGAASNTLKGEDPLTGAAAGALSAGMGYLGGKLFQGPLQKLFNPVSKKYEMVPVGIWTITKPIPQSSIPTWTGSAADAAASEWTNKIIDERLKGNNNESK